MSKSSMLAAVHAAALSSTSVAALSVEPQPTQEPIMNDKTAAPALAVVFSTTTALVAAYPDLCAALRTEGATAERERIIGIEAHALAGHDELIATMKADPTVTPDMAAGRLLGAEKALRGAQLQGVKDVENLTGKVTPAASSSPATPSGEKATSPEGWKAEYAGSEALQAEFGSEGAYLAFKTAEKSGVARIKRS